VLLKWLKLLYPTAIAASVTLHWPLRNNWALTVTVLAGGAQRPRLLASALALVQLRPAGAALHGPSHGACSPAFSPVHVRPIKADENEEKNHDND